MKLLKIISTFLLMWSVGSQAATIAESFDSEGPTGITTTSPLTLGSGFVVSVEAFNGSAFIDIGSSFISGNPTNALVWQDQFGSSAVNLSLLNDVEFTLVQMDVGLTGLGGTYQIFGLDELGNELASMAIDTSTLVSDEWRTITFDSSWQGITTLYVPGEAAGVPGIVGGLDNVVISVVPIPAAAWLFGSALAGLSFIRRKRSSLILKAGFSRNHL